MDTGKPYKAPAVSPRMTPASAARAASRARSPSTAKKALMCGFTASMRASTASMISTGESRRSRIAAASSVAGVKQSSVASIAISHVTVGWSCQDFGFV